MSPKKRQRRTDDERFADAVVEGLKPSFEALRAELAGIRDDHGRKLDQLISGAVGIGRLHALEERVTALEQRR